MKPDWKDAPEWAKWLAKDQQGRWQWWEKEPALFCDRWCDPYVIKVRNEYTGDSDAPEWKHSLESRNGEPFFINEPRHEEVKP